MNYYGMDAAGVVRGAQLPFNFHLIGAKWQARVIDQLVREYEAALPPGASPNWVLGNHDKSRIASRVGATAARLAAMLLLTLRGTPTLYYGDELGMTDVPIPIDGVQDPFEKREPGRGLGRDPERTPMPWRSDGANAGFTTGRPWLPLGRDWRALAVDRQLADSQSMLHLYRRLLALRRQSRSLHEGAWTPLGVSGNVLMYARGEGSDRLVVLLNFGAESAAVPLRTLRGSDASPLHVWLSTRQDREGLVADSVFLHPEEGVILGLVARDDRGVA